MHLVDTTMFFARESGGVKRYLLAKRAWLSRHTGIRHTLLVPDAGDQDDGAGTLTLASPALPFSNGYRLPLDMARWRHRLDSLAPDLIEVGDPYQLAWAALKVGRARDVPVIGFYHSDLVRLIGTRLGGWTAPGLGRYVANLYKRFDLVLAPSRTMVERLYALGIDRVALQPLGVDTALFHPGRRDPGLRRSLGLRDKTRLLLFAGRFAREKNIPVLLDTLHWLGPDYHLLLVGGGGQLRLPPNVTRIPYVGSEDSLARLMASCDAFIHAGDQETFGLVVLEAMACGVPVVGIAAAGVGELVDVTVGMLAPSCHPRLLAEAVAELFERNLQVLGQRCRERAEKYHDWNHAFRILMTHYHHLTGTTIPETEIQLHAAG